MGGGGATSRDLPLLSPSEAPPVLGCQPAGQEWPCNEHRPVSPQPEGRQACAFKMCNKRAFLSVSGCISLAVGEAGGGRRCAWHPSRHVGIREEKDWGMEAGLVPSRFLPFPQTGPNFREKPKEGGLPFLPSSSPCLLGSCIRGLEFGEEKRPFLNLKSTIYVPTPPHPPPSPHTHCLKPRLCPRY